MTEIKFYYFSKQTFVDFSNNPGDYHKWFYGPSCLEIREARRWSSSSQIEKFKKKLKMVLKFLSFFPFYNV